MVLQISQRGKGRLILTLHNNKVMFLVPNHELIILFTKRGNTQVYDCKQEQ